MASIPLTVRAGFAQSAEYRVFELSEKIIADLAEGCPNCPVKAAEKKRRESAEEKEKKEADVKAAEKPSLYDPLEDEAFGAPVSAVGEKRPREEADATIDAGRDKANTKEEEGPAPRLAFTIRGDTDEVVICTHRATYALRRHEFSNNYYLVTSDTHTVHEKVNFVCEVAPTRPRTETIRRLVLESEDAFLGLDEVESWGPDGRPNPTCGSGSGSGRNLLTFDDIIDRSICSRTEAAAFLTIERALLVGGFVRFLHPALAHQVLEAAMHEVHRRAGGDSGEVGDFDENGETEGEAMMGGADVEAEDGPCVVSSAPQLSSSSSSKWSVDSFVLQEVVDGLAGLYPAVIVRAALSTLTERIETSEKEKDTEGGEKEGAAAATATATAAEEVRHRFRRTPVMVALAQGILNPAVTNPNTSPMGTQNAASPLNDMNRRAFLAAWRERIELLAGQHWLVDPSATASAASAPPKEGEGAGGMAAPRDELLMTDKQMLALLGGLVFTNNETNSPETEVVSWAPQWRMPIDLQHRAAYLFSRKPRWPAGELRSFLTPCLEVGQNYDHAIAKYCRELRSADKSVESTFIAV